MHPALVTRRYNAAKALLQVIDEEDYVQHVLESVSSEDRPWLTWILNGFLKDRIRVEDQMYQHLERPEKLPVELQALLLLGTYEILFSTRTPVHTIVDESVEVVKQKISPQLSGIANAVLRKVARGRTEEVSDQDLSAHSISKRFSHPEWIVSRWCARYGLEDTVALCEANQRQWPLTIRTNTTLTTTTDLRRLLEVDGVLCKPGSLLPSLATEITLPQGVRIVDLSSFTKGLFTIQDQASMLPVLALDLKPGHRVLDLCAAPGGKSTHAAELISDQGEVVAIDPSSRRVRLIQQNAERLNLKCIKTVCGDARTLELTGRFDRVLLDAPCSGLGVLGRKSDMRWQKKEGDFAELIRLQRELLEAAIKFLSPNGLLVYSTCTIEPEENEGNLDWLLANHSELQVLEQRGTIPHRDGVAGGYFAVIAFANRSYLEAKD